MNPIMLLLAVSLFIGVRSHKKDKAVPIPLLLLCSTICLMAFYTPRFL